MFGTAYVVYSGILGVTGNLNVVPEHELMLTLNMSLSVATTVLSTLIITIRILMSNKTGGAIFGRRYNKPLEIIIESAAQIGRAHV